MTVGSSSWSPISGISGESDPLWNLGVLFELDGRYWPLSVVSLDGDAHAVKFVQPNILNRPGFSIGKNDGFADEFSLHVSESGEHGRRAVLHSRHDVPGSVRRLIERGRCLGKVCKS